MIILAITGVFGGGDSSDSTDAPPRPARSTRARAPTANGNDFATIPLKAPSGDASGTALIGVATGDQAYVDVSIKNLDPAPEGETYVIWMMLTTKQGYPLTPIDGTRTAPSTTVPRSRRPCSPVVARVQNINVSLAKVSDVRSELKTALKNTSVVIDRIGTTVLDGPVPKSEQTSAPSATTPDGSTTAPETTTTPAQHAGHDEHPGYTTGG